MALAYANVSYELREVELKHKPAAMLELSPKGTVPVLQLNDQVIDESLDVMAWAFEQSDPDSLFESSFPHSLVERNDNYFKHHLDRYKYFERYPEQTQKVYLEQCMVFLRELESTLSESKYLLGEKMAWVDIAIFPFIRQFAFSDKVMFDSLPLPKVQCWLAVFLESELFTQVMKKYPPWRIGQKPLTENAS